MIQIIRENQKGFLFRNGRYLGLLSAGKHRVGGAKTIEVTNLDQPVSSACCSLDTLLADPAVEAATSVVTVPDGFLALHFIDGSFAGVLRTGRYAFWATEREHSYRMVDLAEPEVDESIPRYIFGQIPSTYYTKVEVNVYQKARLYYDRRFQRLLEPGVYYFWNNGTAVDAGFVDTRLSQLNIGGQEMLTRDKVSLRINFVCSYRITDPRRCLTEVEDFREQIYVAAQLALREYVGQYCLDELLESKDQLADFVLKRLKQQEEVYYVEFSGAGIKDLILPGEVRAIMNTVLVAEKRAQANVITRREEVASTRSLLNTARLMEENPTLYKLKELEYVERICENVGSISLGGSGDLLSQLAALLKAQ